MVDTGLTEHNMCSHMTTIKGESTIAYNPKEHGGWGDLRYKPEPKKNSIKKVIFNDPATIILWEDGTKTVVKCNDGYFDPEKGMAMAIAKKYLGNKGNYYNEFVKWLPAHCLEESDDELFVDILKQLLN